MDGKEFWTNFFIAEISKKLPECTCKESAIRFLVCCSISEDIVFEATPSSYSQQVSCYQTDFPGAIWS